MSLKALFQQWNKTGLILFVLGILFIVLGLLRGDTLIVLNKAIRICLECVGIG